MMPKAAEAPKAAPKAAKAAPKAAKAAPKAAKAPPKAPKSSRDFAPDLPKYVALLVASKLAETTKVQYESRLGKLVDATGRPVAWTLGHCVESWASLRQVYGAENYRTLRTFVNLALSMLSHHAEQAGMPASAAREAHACWTKLYALVSPLALEHYETNENEPTEKMKGSHVPWAELERVRDRLISDDGEEEGDAGAGWRRRDGVAEGERERGREREGERERERERETSVARVAAGDHGEVRRRGDPGAGS